jgi:predicted Zn finger-like uncharacterized protein
LSVFTQCSKCETVFELAADVLRTAGGQVRCGNCGEVFNALARLAEDSSAFVAGETPIDLEARADRILESAAAMPVAKSEDKDSEEAGRSGVEIARLEVFDWPEEDPAAQDDADRSMEFTLPPGELDRIFVESKRPVPPKRPSDPTQADPTPAVPTQQATKQAPPPVPKPAQKSVPKPAPTSTPGTTTARTPAPTAAAAPNSTPGAVAAGNSAPKAAPKPAKSAAPPAPPPHPESVAAESAPERNRVSGFEIPEDVRRDMAEGFEQYNIAPTMELRKSAADGRRRPFIMWLSAAIVSALLLMVQVVHENREWFVTHAHGPMSAVVRTMYGAMGSPLPLPSNLSAYQLRQWGVTGDPQANGILRLRASILNAAPQLQPYPLLRVTLADRFGKSIGRRDFEPSEYMGKPTARLLAPGERADATLEILDPGKNAEGFEIDVCLRGVDKQVSCANDIAPQTGR